MKWGPTKPPPGIKLNHAHPLARGLVGCWLMNEGTGSKVADLSGNGNDGDIEGATWAGSKSGGGLDFDGTDDYIRIANSDSLNFGSGAFSVSAWVNSSASYAGAEGEIVEKRGETVPYWVLRFEDGASAGKIHFQVADAEADYANSLSSSTYNDGAWHYIVAVYYGNSTSKIYIDGEHESVDTASGTVGVFDAGDDVLIGKFVLGDYFNDSIDEVRIWNRDLSATEAKELSQNPYGMFDYTRTLFKPPIPASDNVLLEAYDGTKRPSTWQFRRPIMFYSPNAP